MKRDFILREISFEEYVSLIYKQEEYAFIRKQWEMSPNPPSQKSLEAQVARKKMVVKHLQLIDCVRYPNLGALLDDVNDNVETLDLVSAFDRSLGEACRGTRRDRQGYFEELVRKEGQYLKIAVRYRIGNRHIHGNVHIIDYYAFVKKQDNTWLLRKLAIGRHNFGRYKLNIFPMQDLSGVDRLHAVYSDFGV